MPGNGCHAGGGGGGRGTVALHGSYVRLYRVCCYCMFAVPLSLASMRTSD